ncbi:MAG TPA: hypothetical protein VE994_19910 [Terriglobales bacterium]|nr:hypothetical protein [Terriglobales bacterium]
MASNGLRIAIIAVSCLWLAGTTALVPRPSPPKKLSDVCKTPEYRQFDFFVGDWDGFETSDRTHAVARNRVQVILDGCVVLEDYEGEDAHKGESFSIYDATRKVWHQTWVTNGGKLLVIEGKLENGAMVLSGSDLTEDGRRRLVRGTRKQFPGGVRENAETSVDGGKSWQVWFDMEFRPHQH